MLKFNYDGGETRFSTFIKAVGGMSMQSTSRRANISSTVSQKDLERSMFLKNEVNQQEQ